MTKTIAFALAMASIGLAFAAPAQAATRAVDIHAELFADRCLDQGGVITAQTPSLSCQTEDVAVDCSFVTLNRAWCAWPGIDGQIAVNRLIGMQDAQSVDGSGSLAVGNGGGGKGGGFKLPDLPLDSGNGGGGIKLPNLPLSDK